MNDDEQYDPLDDGYLRLLLRDAVSDVHPEPALEAIRRRTRGSAAVRRLRPVLAVTAAAATVAAIVGGITLANQPATTTPPVTKVAGPPTAGVPTGTPTDSRSPYQDFVPKAEGIYYVGDTPRGPRLYREFQSVLVSPRFAPLSSVVMRALGQDALDGPVPRDPDYRTLWPSGTKVDQTTIGVPQPTISLTNDSTDLAVRPAGMTAQAAELSVQQLVYTVQAAKQNREPVRFQINQKDTPTLLGVDVSQPVPAAPQVTVLALVSVTEPAEGAVVTGSFRAQGVASSFEANVPWEIRQGSVVVMSGASTASGWIGRLYPWTTDPIDVSGLAPGSYTFVALTDDPSGGAGAGPTSDTRTIVVRR